jgi:hypothetical protein
MGRVAGVLSWWAGFVPAFVLTCVIEAPCYLIGCRLLGGRLAWPAVVMINLATHPLLWALALHWPGPWRLLALEAAVVVVEAALLWALQGRRAAPGERRLSIGDAVVVSLLANAASALLGTILLGTGLVAAVMAGVASWASS